MKGRVVVTFLVYGVIANVPVWLASRWLGFSLNGLFSIEYVVIGILSLFVGRALTACLLFCFMSLDVVYSIGRTYMLSPRDLMSSAASAPLFIELHGWTIAAIVAPVALTCWLSSMGIGRGAALRERAWVASGLVVFACCGIAVDYSRGNITAVAVDYQHGGARLVRNSLHGLVLDIRNARSHMYGESQEAARGMNAASAKLQLVSGVPGEGVRPNIVFVVVESWGKALSQPLFDAMLSPYMTAGMKRSYVVETGEVPFHGPTVSGEMRELCGSSLGFGVISAPASSLRECLPGRVERLGYHTVAIHGFQGNMFSRNAWYPKIDFEETWFEQDLAREGLARCGGPFPGICDAAIGGWIGERLDDSKGPQFIYWLTLNSHLPVPVSNGVKDPPPCSGVAVLADDALCAWYQLIFNVHRSVAALAEKERERPTVFVVVGDHAPPFSVARRRSEFSYDVVPYVVLTPKSVMEQPQPARSLALAKPSGRRQVHQLSPAGRESAHTRSHGE